MVEPGGGNFCEGSTSTARYTSGAAAKQQTRPAVSQASLRQSGIGQLGALVKGTNSFTQASPAILLSPFPTIKRTQSSGSAVELNEPQNVYCGGDADETNNAVFEGSTHALNAVEYIASTARSSVATELRASTSSCGSFYYDNASSVGLELDTTPRPSTATCTPSRKELYGLYCIG